MVNVREIYFSVLFVLFRFVVGEWLGSSNVYFIAWHFETASTTCQEKRNSLVLCTPYGSRASIYWRRKKKMTIVYIARLTKLKAHSAGLSKAAIASKLVILLLCSLSACVVGRLR